MILRIPQLGRWSPLALSTIRRTFSPAQIFQAIGRLRKDARDEIERLLNFLDSTDSHMEREPDLGWPERFGQCGGVGGTDDTEDDSELNEDGGDAEPDLCDEPSLGALEQPIDQTRWAQGNRSDREVGAQ